MNPQYFCKTCKRTMDEDQFYTSTRADRYPNGGKLFECKKCVTRHVDNWDPETYLWILEEVNVPYIETEWSNLLKKYGGLGKKVTGMTVLGRYLSKMKLKQFSIYTWDDTEKLKIEAEARQTQVMRDAGYSGEEIALAIETGTMPEKPADPDAETTLAAEPIDLTESAFFEDDLTEDDKKYLTIKWGRAYRPYEWVQLEQYYQNMMNAFDIQTPAHIDYLKLICKTSFKAHQLIDLGDVEGFQKMVRVYDTLMKSAKFTAVQNKTDGNEYVNAVSEFVLLCEKEGFIPKYYIDKPGDKVDETLQDMMNYTRTLVTEEADLGSLIESALKTIQQQEDIVEEPDIDDQLQDDDYAELFEMINAEKAADEEAIQEEEI